MATANSTVSGAPSGQAADSGGSQHLLQDIKDTKGELDDVKKEIKELKPLVEANHDFKGHGLYSSHAEAKAALQELKAEKARLQGLLLQYETRLTAQQQSGAGTWNGACTSLKLVRAIHGFIDFGI
jgi:DNA repair exonuclease SbcCD ATPase subunit